MKDRTLAEHAIKRRAFLGWSGGWIAAAVPGVAALELVACGGGSSSPTSSPAVVAPATGVTVIENPSTLSISIQSRQVQWLPGKSPAQANAWV